MMVDDRCLGKNVSDKSASKTNLAYELVRSRHLDHVLIIRPYPHGAFPETGLIPLVQTHSPWFPGPPSAAWALQAYTLPAPAMAASDSSLHSYIFEGSYHISAHFD